MATGQILHLGLHVTALMKNSEGTSADQPLCKQPYSFILAYFSVDRYVFAACWVSSQINIRANNEIAQIATSSLG